MSRLCKRRFMKALIGRTNASNNKMSLSNVPIAGRAINSRNKLERADNEKPRLRRERSRFILHRGTPETSASNKC